MSPRLSLLSAFAILLVPAGSFAASASGNQEQEFQQIRKIALRDPKVQAAYDDADRRLEAKIIAIDPALAAYARTRKGGINAPATEVAKAEPAPHKPVTEHFTTPKTAPKKSTATTSAPSGTTHTVAKGETLSSIAAQYGVTVAALKSANQIEDEKKLAIGKVLTIPKHGATAAPAAAHQSAPAPAPKSQSTWDRVKNSF